MKRHLAFILYLVFTGPIVAPLAAQDFHVQHYTVGSGLSDDYVTDVHQDAFGYVWISTAHGLNLYNGHEFKIFRYDPEDSFSIRANSLSRLYEDPDSNIWVSLSVGGVSKYDRYQDRFYYYNANPERGQDPNNFVQTLITDCKNRTWVGTSTHINLLDAKAGIYRPVAVAGHDQLHVYGIYEDAKNRVWIGTAKGLFRLNEQKQVFEELKDENGRSLLELVEFQEDHEGNLWAASSHEVFMLNDGQARQIPTPAKRYITSLFLAGEGQLYISLYEDKIYHWEDDVWKVPPGFSTMPKGLRYAHAEDGDQHIFIADNARGYFLYHPTEGTTQYLATIDETIRSFWFGRHTQELWLGSPDNGLYRIDLQPKMARHYLPALEAESEQPAQNWVNSMVRLDESKALIAVSGQLYKFDKTGHFEAYTLSNANGLTIHSVRKFNGGEIILQTDDGLARLNTQSHRIKPLKATLPEGSFDFWMANDSLWSIGEYGLALNRSGASETQFFRELEYLPETFRTGELRSLCIDNSGVLWIGTVREGLLRIQFDRKTGRYATKAFSYGGVRSGPFKSHTVNTIIKANGKLWIGGFSSGLLEFDRDTETFINRNPEGEVPIPHIYMMVEAADHSIWLSAKDGVHRYDPADDSFHQYSERDGLSKATFNLQVGALLGHNLVGFGSEEGLTVFDTDRFVRKKQVSKVLMEKVSVENTGLTLRFPAIQEPYRLKYNENFLSFDFIALNYQDPTHVRYQYRLKGLEKDWKTVKHRHVQYANLGPGKYTFELRAGLESGNWSKQITRFEFNIHQPFWWQPWFLVLVALLLMTIVLLVNKVRMNMKLSRIKALETVRQNAAADFHDEMGNKLTRISLFTEVLEKKLNGTSPEISSYVKKIKDNSHVLNNSMRDFLWALDPEKDTAFDLIVMLKDFGDELFDNSGIGFNVASIKEIFREYPLDMDWKRHLVMIFKEAMHNALKHSSANTVTLKASLSKDVLNLSLTDDGQGFKRAGRHGGYGHANMKRRAEALGASISIESKEGEGTAVTFIGTLTKKYETYD